MMVKIGDVNYDYPGQGWQQKANPVQNIRKTEMPINRKSTTSRYKVTFSTAKKMSVMTEISC